MPDSFLAARDASSQAGELVGFDILLGLNAGVFRTNG